MSSSCSKRDFSTVPWMYRLCRPGAFAYAMTPYRTLLNMDYKASVQTSTDWCEYSVCRCIIFVFLCAKVNCIWSACFINKFIWDYAMQKYHSRYSDATMGAIASQITSLTIVYSIVYSDADQREYQSSAVAGEFTAQMTSNAGNVPIWWRHHVSMECNYSNMSSLKWQFSKAALEIRILLLCLTVFVDDVTLWAYWKCDVKYKYCLSGKYDWKIFFATSSHYISLGLIVSSIRIGRRASFDSRQCTGQICTL